ncbi:MAG: hypothetical protein WC803_12800 [Sphingomonas sp.]|jgi:hypothetical protein
MKKHEVAVSVLSEEMAKIGGSVFSQFLVRLSPNDETKKTLEANDFLNAIMTGGKIKEEWKLENDSDFKRLQNIVSTLNQLIEESNSL